jgi:phosphopantetheinyl transferase
VEPATRWEPGAARPKAWAGEVHVWRAEGGNQKEALREVLSHYLDEAPASIALQTGVHGKPSLADSSSPLRFNLSHSGAVALVAVTRELEVGVDVQRIGSRHGGAFYEEWARREAIVKCAGTSLLAPVSTERIAVEAIDAGPDYAAALAVTGDEVPPMRLFALGE